MKRFLNSVLCMCIAVFCTHAQKKNVTSVLEVMDITTGQRSVVKEFPFLIEAPNWTPDGNWLVYIVEENYISSLRNLRESRN